jgi:hypothetical protein
MFERHVAGVATSAEAAALASHALTCGRCARALDGVREFEAKFGPPPDAPRRPARAHPSWRTRHPWIVAVLAAIVTAAAAWATWEVALRPRAAQPVFRGRGGTLALVATWQPDGTLRLSWPRGSDGLPYTVRISGSTGVEILKSSTGPQVALTAAEAATLGDLDVIVESDSPDGSRTSRRTSLRLSRSTPRAP